MSAGYPRTLSMWIKFNSIVSGTLWSAMSDGTNNFYIFVQNAANNKVLLVDGGGFAQVTSNNPVTTGVWIHVVALMTGPADRTIYLDNDPATTTASGGILANTMIYTSLGHFWNGGAPSNYFDGLMKDYAIWTTGLTPEEITALFKGASPIMVRPSSLQTYFPLVNGNLNGFTSVGGTLTNFNSSTASNDNPRIYQ